MRMIQKDLMILDVDQTCPKCGDIQSSVSTSMAEYIHRYGCYRCRLLEQKAADQERRDRATTNERML